MRGRPAAGRTSRRSLRGLSLLDSALLLSLLVVTAALGIDVVGRLAHALAAESEAVSLSRLADAARRHAARNPEQLMRTIGLNPDSHVLFTAADLVSTGSLPPGGRLITSRRRAVTVAAAAASAGTGEERIVVLAWTGAAISDRPARPRAAAEARAVGRIGSGNDGCGADRICGPGLDWDASGILGLLNPAPPAGAMAALRLVHFAADRDPYVHRLAAAGNMNRVEGDFDIQGQALRITGTGLAVGELQVGGDITVADGAEFGEALVAGSASVTGSVEAGSVVAAESTAGTDPVSPSVTASGSVTAGTLEVSARLGAASWSGGAASTLAAEGMDVAGELTLTNRLRVEDSWPSGSTPPTDAPRLTAGRADIDRTVTVFADGTWGTGEISFELTDVNQEARFGRGLELDAGGIGLIEQLETTGCTGC